MGNYKFRLSDMLPNSWFYKLRDNRKAGRNKSIRNSVKQSNTTSTTVSSSKLLPIQSSIQQDYLPNRASCYLPSKDRIEKLPRSPINTKASDTHFPVDSPVKCRPKTLRITENPSAKLLLSSALATSCDCSGNSTPMHKSDDEFSYQVTSSETDIFIDVGDESSSTLFPSFQYLEDEPELNLPPILTKPVKKESKGPERCNSNVVVDEKRSAAARRIKVRADSPRLASRKVLAYRNLKAVQLQHKRPFSDSFLVVKSSLEPLRDFRESMLDMIIENNISDTSDLEELLACYLSLNCKEHHGVIVRAFEQIWFELNDIEIY